ncbi:cyclophilin-like fold protein [uncultured Limosilactobacillus sp.]|uniref:cyclophilin-like fold protein n=1 Tax=uncultured Limosilactobacillus sp. TaxID=2837629 RepID=UPI0025E5FD5F|nr:cyclophilin-like fold protein [uncultured Limosilactobacillus sp.]
MSEKTLVEITVNHDVKLTAQFEDNAATRELVSRMPFTIEMDNLYSREMCHRYGRGGLPVDNARDQGYQVGDISYWPPMGSLVFLYKQNGEVFEQQPIGHIDNDISFFNKLGAAQVTFRIKD